MEKVKIDICKAQESLYFVKRFSQVSLDITN
jgi:hypothetical protein